MTIFRLRALIFHISGPHAPNIEEARPKNWSARNWALVALFGILAIAGLEGFALCRGIDGDALRAALVSIGVLGGAGVGRLLK